MRNSSFVTSITILAVLLLTVPVAAQTIQNLPRVSPGAHVMQRVGVADVEISYHRPSVNERKIWGGIVPYGQVWRAGANDNTTITFSHPAKVEGQDLDAGTYGLHMLPGENEWQVIFSQVSTAWGSFSYDESEDALRVTVQPQAAPHLEQLSYGFEDVTNDSAVVTMRWEELEVPFTVAFDTPALALAEIESQLRHIPRFSWQGWSSAAQYLVNNDYEHEKAMQWIDRSIQMNENGQNLGVKVRLLRQLDREEEAREILARALEISNEAEVNQLGYQFLFGSGDADTAIAIFQHNVDHHPESWNAHDSLGEAYAAKGETQRARELYEKARSMAPEAQHQRIDGILAGLEDE